MEIQRRWHLQGIVSSSLFNDDQRCDVTRPSVFTNVVHFVDWILDNTKIDSNYAATTKATITTSMKTTTRRTSTTKAPSSNLTNDIVDYDALRNHRNLNLINSITCGESTMDISKIPVYGSEGFKYRKRLLSLVKK